jgi:bifunctional non-homologous end joining protein LigD
MGLELYRSKRNFRTTPEPAGRVARRRPRAPRFVIQKHAASHLHYDFRLELNGVLLSWAVPKGPSLDPRDKRLAMHVEDHPLEYGDFEGVIPPKQYGSGTVLLWDRGYWEPEGDAEAGYRAGKLKFQLHGEKLRGGWILVRSHGGKYGGERSWLLIKEKDAEARSGADARIVDTEPDSVASGRSLEAIAGDPERVWRSDRSVAENVRAGRIPRKKVPLAPEKIDGARKAPLPESMAAQLALLVAEPPAGDGWLHEIKYDGYRMLCRVADGKCRMMSRNGKDWTTAFPRIADAVAHLPVASAWIDGEVVVVDTHGRTSFQALQNALSNGASATLVFYAFDLPYVNGYDLRGAALVDRKTLLRKIVGAGSLVRFSEHVEGSGPAFFGEACRLGLEGIVSKRADARYEATRGRAWQKVKCALRQEFVVGGYTDPQGSRTGFGALLLGVYEGSDLRYCGKVGTGFDDALLKRLAATLKTLRIDAPPFVDPPTGAEGRRARWVKPRIVAEVSFTEWTRDGTLRHPSFEGVREDKRARDVVRERPAQPAATAPAMLETRVSATKPPATKRASAAKRAPATMRAPAATHAPAAKRAAAKKTSSATNPVAPAKPGPPPKRAARRATSDALDAVAGVAISSGDKLLYPEAGLTKLDLARYYEAVGEWIVPHLRDRPLTLVRCPNGWESQCFYQKHATASVSELIDRIDIRDAGGVQPYMMANSAGAVVALLQMGVLEMHPWGSRAPKLGYPDRLIFDFDPDESLGWTEIVDAVRMLRKLLGTLELESFVKTTGGKGLHVVVPIEPTRTWDEAKAFCKAIAEMLVRAFPDRFTSNLLKARRVGRIFIDYLRNAQGATAVAPYSTRAKARAPVAMPIAWTDLARDVRFDHFNVRNVPAILRRRKRDPWEALSRTRQKVTDAALARVGAAATTKEK